MKKVLILAYDFPPYISVGGLRPKAWLDYFGDFEIDPVVITRQWNSKYKNDLDYITASESNETKIEISKRGTVIRTPYKPNLSNRLLLKYGSKRFRLIRKIITAYFELFQYIFPIGPKKQIFLEANKFLSENQVDCIIATGDPFVLFQYAAKLSKKYNTPWIADYRDAWSSIFEKQNKPIEKSWNRYFEKKIIPSAKQIIVVSEFIKMKVESVIAHPHFSIQPNGFNPVSFENIESGQEKSNKLRIAMVGSILDWHPIDHFLQTFTDFVNNIQQKDIEVIFFGVNNKDNLEKKIKTDFPRMLNHIKLTEKIPNKELMAKVSNCNALLLFNNFSFMGTKIYDYIGLRRKIILCFTDDPVANKLKFETFPVEENEHDNTHLQADLIAETNSGIAVKDAAHLKVVLQDLWDEFSTTGQIACNSVNVENYSRKIQVQKLAELIHSIC